MTSEKSVAFRLDRVDYKLLRELARNGRAPATHLGKVAHIKAETVKRRLDRLRAGGVLTDIVGLVDYSALNLQVRIVSWRLTDAKEQHRVWNLLRSDPDITMALKLRNQSHRFATVIVARTSAEIESIIGRFEQALGGLIEERHTFEVIHWAVPAIIPQRVLDEWLDG